MTKAQVNVGLGLGYSNNHLSTDISDRSFTKNKNGKGMGGELKIEYTGYNNAFDFQTAISFLQKKYSFIRTDSYGIYENFKNSYLQIPVIVKLKFVETRKFQVFLDGGFYCSYWFSAKAEGVAPDIFNSYDSVNPNGTITQYLKLSNYSEKYP